MATLEQCRKAVEGLAERMRASDRRAGLGDRSLSCQVSDLDVTFSGMLRGGELVDMTTEPAAKAQIRMTVSSDDLVALTSGELDLMKAWLAKRIRIEASMLDLIKLKTIF
ncbi:MAG: SCP2 sterol-binding domain-containing protein [Streptosporangiales bacterium]|nr:SCP2 sterol-binding domain-containing protein [Streptosporangiales bacterium]